MESWFHHPQNLFRADTVLEFWPTDKQTPAERINASTRFILYLACILYLIKRDVRILILAAMVIGVLYMFDKSGSVRYNGTLFKEPGLEDELELPPIQYYANKSRGPTPSVQNDSYLRQFSNGPTPGVLPGEGFVEYCYGSKFQPTCRDNQEYCNPNMRGAQLEAYGGRMSRGSQPN